jgi:acid phosphatase type 7
MRVLFDTALALSLLCTCLEAAPRHVYLTWQGDPTTSITVNLHTIVPGEGAPGAMVHYDTLAHGGQDWQAYAFHASGTQQRLVDLADRVVHRVQLTDLQPDRVYWFVAGDSTGLTAERAFRTIPDTAGRLRFIAAGDMGVAEPSRRLQAVAAAQEPRFALLGGDLAYTNGDWRLAHIWDMWLDNWQELMVTPSGLTVPMVSAIGNHEVAGGYNGTPDKAPIYLQYLAQDDERSYFVRRVGPRLVIFLLDSGHLTKHAGAQTEWLTQQLTAHAAVPVRLATYHVPLFPGFRLPSGRYSRAGRKHWQPLFDRYGLMAAFENHDHIFKRTHPIRGDSIDPQGTIYLGDGSFGRGPRVIDGPRQTHLHRRWYLDKLRAEGHIWRVDIEADSVVFAAVNRDGDVFDRVTRSIP